MGWIQHGEVWDDDGQHGDTQIGKAASVRFFNPDLPGRLVTVYAFPSAPELGSDAPLCSHARLIVKDLGNGVAQYAPLPSEHLRCSHDMDRVGVESLIEFMICEDLGDPGGTEEWSEYRYGPLDTRPYSGTAEVMIAEAEQDALAWIMRYDADKFIAWDGERL